MKFMPSLTGQTLRRIVSLLTTILTGMLTATGVQAQSRVFVDGAAVADLDHGGTARGLGVGVALSPRYNLRFEVEVAPWDASQDQSCGSRACLELNYATRTTSYSFLAARRFQPTDRFQLEVLAGLGLLVDSMKASGYFDTLAADGTVATHHAYDDHAADHYLGFTMGLDAPIPVARHVTVVPRWRGHSYVATGYGPHGYSMTGIAVRWRF